MVLRGHDEVFSKSKIPSVKLFCMLMSILSSFTTKGLRSVDRLRNVDDYENMTRKQQ